MQVCDELEDAEINISAGGVIIEYHGCDFFPVRYFQRVVVRLRCSNREVIQTVVVMVVVVVVAVVAAAPPPR